MRYCWQCSTEIILCNGYVGGDIAALLVGEEPKSPIYETCSKCVERYEAAIELGLPKPFLLPSEKPA